MKIQLGDTIKDERGREGEVVNIGIATDKSDIAGELGLSAKEYDTDLNYTGAVSFGSNWCYFNQIKEVINPQDFYHSPKSKLICVENTSNRGGGAFYDFKEIKKIKELAVKNNLKLHLDGARLWNALEETSEKPKDYGDIFDTISVCFSKGLGCPVGSALIGSNKNMEKALRIRKVFGGGMRQSGYLAAAALFALENNRSDLKKDHIKAKEIASVLTKLSFVKSIEPVSTNIIIFSLTSNELENKFVNLLKEKNIHIISLGKGKLRIVTHLDYTGKHHQYFLNFLKKINL